MASSSYGNISNTGNLILKRANPSTIQDKLMVGYQGWFTCPGDGEPMGPDHHGWLHWIDHPIPDGGRPNIDIWPDVSAYSPSELFPVPGLTTKTGEPVFVFSSRNAKTVQRHFHWMAKHGVDGVFLQRFAGQCDLETGNAGIRRIRDEVGDRVKEAAEREGRVFAIMYDVSGVAPDHIQRILEQDWAHLVRNKGVLDSPNYLKEKGKPVVALWGFGFEGARHTPALVRAITHFFRSNTPGGVYIVGGSPASWRTAEGDADRNPGFLDVWMNDFDAISPWTIGRYETEKDADKFCESKMQGDFDLIQQHNEEGRGRKVDYIPVVFPGGSGYNLSKGKWAFNNIKRNGGRFLWKQISNAKRLGVRTIYGAMWDEYDEGTAFMPVVELKGSLPESDKFRFMALDEDGYDCPADWYMRICGYAAEGLRSERRIHETFPIKELQDYWSSRPKYEPVPKKSEDFLSGSSAFMGAGASASGAGSGEGDGQTYQEWLGRQKEEKEEAPPPPYSLEADEEASSTATPAVVTSTPAQLSVERTAEVSVAVVPPVSSQTPASTATVPHVAPQVNAGATVVNSGTHPPPRGGSTQQYPPVQTGASYGDPNPAQAQHYQPAANTTTTSPAADHQTPQDPVTSRAHDYGRQSISGPSLPHGSGSLVGGRIPGGSTPPLHPAHPAGGSTQQYPPVQTGASYGGPNPAQAQQYQLAANTTTTSLATHHQTPQDPVTSLAHDYGRQSISGPSFPHGSGGPVGGRILGGEPPPLHPAHPAGGPTQQYPPVQTGASYGGPNPAQAQQYQLAANTTTTSPATHHQTPQDSITSLAHDYGRQNISGPSLPHGSGGPVSGRIPAGSPPPLHPAHPAAANANPSYATGPAHPRPHPSHAQTQPPPRPPSQPRPSSQPDHHLPRPQSQQGHHHHQSHLVPSVGAAKPPTNETPRPGAPSQSQWPPPEWEVQPAAHTVPHSSYPAYPNQLQPPTQGVGGVPLSSSSGANISRPHAVSVSSYGGANLRPDSSHGSRPSNPTTPPSSFPSSPIPENQPLSSAYPVPSSYNPQSAFSVSPPQATIPLAAPTPDAPFHGHGHTPTHIHRPVHGAPNFNMPSPSPYLPPFLLTTYPGPSGQSTYPGQQQASAYPPSNYGGGGWPGGPPPSSPPAGMPTFSGQSSYGNNSRPYGGPTQGPPPQSHYPGGPSFPSSHQSSPLGTPGGSEGGRPFFPQGPGGDGGYFGNSSNVTMPVSSIASTSTSPYTHAGSSSPAMYPGQYSSYPGQAAGGGVSYLQAAVPTPGPWMPSGPPGPSTSMPPNFPPRPPSKPSSSSSFQGLALSAVDKVAGKKTREQLEHQVENLTHTGAKLFHKFTK